MAANDDVMEHLHALMHAFRSQMKRALQEAGHDIQAMEVRALMWIAAHPGAAARELAQHSGRDKAQMARVIGQLEQAGLIERSLDESDRRVQRLNLTQEGSTLHTALRRERRTVSARLLARLDEGEQRQLAALLARLADQD